MRSRRYLAPELPARQRKKARSDFSDRALPPSSPCAAIGFVRGTLESISIFLGSATAATGAVIWSTPFTNSALIFSLFRPPGGSSAARTPRR
jgi:hypothetical protein